jgi:hypothetical protein
MPITLSFDIEQASIQDPNDRMRIELSFKRFGWEHVGGSSWRYPALGTDEHPSEDWFNHVVPALMYFRSLVAHSGMNVTKFTIDAHSEAGYRGTAIPPIGQPILSGTHINMYAPRMAPATEATLSEQRLKQFFQSAEDSL